MLQRVRAFAERHHLWRPETRVVAALSGGADSVALLLILRELHEAGDIVLDAAAHLHHGIRGVDADADEEFCRSLCARMGVPFVTARVDVPSTATRDRLSVEVAARRARHSFFTNVLASRSADRVATAHTEDDQAETVLLRLVRGTGGRGLAGIAPKRNGVVRPLLSVTRGELRALLVARGQDWREDRTNADLSNPRNRVRHELLPYLAAHFNPSVSRALARLADVAGAEEAWLDGLVDQVCGQAISNGGDGPVSVTGLADMPHGLARRVARRALETANPDRSFGVDEVEMVLAVATGRRGPTEISGLRVERFRDSEVLLKRAANWRPRRRGVGV